MGYQIDVAFDMRIVGSMTNLYDMFVKKAEKNNCEMFYMNYEFDGIGRNIVRNHSVMSFFFPPERKEDQGSRDANRTPDAEPHHRTPDPPLCLVRAPPARPIDRFMETFPPGLGSHDLEPGDAPLFAT